MEILVGADPELFVTNPNTGKFVSGHNMIPGTKHNPFKVNLGAVQVDGTALEFNIDPAHSLNEFITNINSVKKQIEEFVPGYNVLAVPVATYEQEYFDWEVPSSAKELGCDPDYNAWTMDINPRPDPGDRPIRTGAGHIHIGWTNDQDVFDVDHFELCAKITRQLDYYLGIYSLLWDNDSTRRQLYGKAGAMRPKSYGVEYRVLSNSWLNNDALITFVYNQAIQGVKEAFKGNLAENVYSNSAQSIIDNSLVNWQETFNINLTSDKKVA